MKNAIVILCCFLGAATASANEIKVETLAKSTRSWDGNLLPAYLRGQPEISIVKITIPPKERVDWHSHPVPIGAYILKGSLMVKTGKRKRKLFKAGDAVIETVGRLHRGFNPGKEETEIVVFFAGVKGVPNSIPKRDAHGEK